MDSEVTLSPALAERVEIRREQLRERLRETRMSLDWDAYAGNSSGNACGRGRCPWTGMPPRPPA